MAFTIRELESLSGIKAHTIRIWEQRYHFLKPSRTQTNIRTYSNEELKTLLTVSLLNRYGYKISRIDTMLPEQRTNAVLDLPQSDAQTENLVNEMIGCMIDLRSTEFEMLLDRFITQRGLESTVTELIFRFLEKVGILWQTNRILPLQEHIVSNIIRQKIVKAIDGLPFPLQSSPLFVLFLPEDEHHEMGLLFVYYLLRREGIPVIYLGANVPLEDVVYLCRFKSPQFLYAHLTISPKQQHFSKFLSQITSGGSVPQLLFSGSAVYSLKKPLPPSVQVLTSFSEVISYVSRLGQQ